MTRQAKREEEAETKNLYRRLHNASRFLNEIFPDVGCDHAIDKIKLSEDNAFMRPEIKFYVCECKCGWGV